MHTVFSFPTRRKETYTIIRMGWLSLVCSLLTNPLLAQSKLSGYVTEQNSGKKPVADMMIKSAGANSIASSNTGKFILTYQGFGAGKNVVVRAEKDGWELVNEKEMSTLIPANPDEKPLKIIVCKAGTLAQAKKAYHDISDDYLLKQYNLKMAALNRQKEGWQQEAAKLDEQLQQLQKQLDEMADEFSRVNLDDATEIERQAIALFKAGKIDESIKKRESLDSGEEIKKNVQAKAKADSAIALHTRNLKELAKDYILKFDFAGAEAKYEELVLADTTNVDNIFEFAYFLDNQKHYKKAIKYYQISLKLTGKEDFTANIQNNLGIIYCDSNDLIASLIAYQKALEVYERLAKNNPATYEPDMARTQNNLGNFYRDKSDFENALISYNKALEIYARFAKTNPTTFESLFADVQNNLGILYNLGNDINSALLAYQKALEIYARFSKDNPGNFDPKIAMIQINLGVLYRYNNRLVVTG